MHMCRLDITARDFVNQRHSQASLTQTLQSVNPSLALTIRPGITGGASAGPLYAGREQLDQPLGFPGGDFTDRRNCLTSKLSHHGELGGGGVDAQGREPTSYRLPLSIAHHERR